MPFERHPNFASYLSVIDQTWSLKMCFLRENSCWEQWSPLGNLLWQSTYSFAIPLSCRRILFVLLEWYHTMSGSFQCPGPWCGAMSSCLSVYQSIMYVTLAHESWMSSKFRHKLQCSAISVRFGWNITFLLISISRRERKILTATGQLSPAWEISSGRLVFATTALIRTQVET